MASKHVSKSEYTKRARKLRTLGFNLKWNPNNRNLSGPHYKASVNKAWHRAVYYAVNTEKNRLEFKRFRTKKARLAWKGHVADETIMPGGVFIQRPRGVKKGTLKVRLGRTGSLIITDGRKGIRDISIKLDISAIAIDPRKALERALSNHKRPRELMLTANGFDRTAGVFSDLEQFNRYLEEELVPRLDLAEFNYEKYGKKVFGVRLIYSPKGGKLAPGEGKTFDFKKGSIFDESTKRVYGRKSAKGRKRFVTKKGKRKGT